MTKQVDLLLLSAWQLHEGFSTYSHGKPCSLHGLFTLCESFENNVSFVISALFNLQGFSLFFLIVHQVLYPSSYVEPYGFGREYETLSVIILICYEADLSVGFFIITIF